MVVAPACNLSMYRRNALASDFRRALVQTRLKHFSQQLGQKYLGRRGFWPLSTMWLIASSPMVIFAYSNTTLPWFSCTSYGRDSRAPILPSFLTRLLPDGADII